MIYVFLADGFEDLEAIAPIDILKRAKFNLKTVGIGGETITSTLGLVVKPDIEIESEEVNTQNLEAIVLPGGMPGTKNLDKCEKLHEIIKFCIKNEILIGAICAAPMILGEMGMLQDRRAVCFPGCEPHMKGADILQDSICKDGKIITARGPGVAVEFAFSLVTCLKGKSATEIIKKSMQCSNNLNV
ncbi:MAG: DJ-1/PfpI family protein [Oscillospiraceae bacterium]|jgi:4-methyl-5(b-hydroxyethyl)-thiazole monophosphate biosynthesis|nr:DJ-1/PfpI family protein [Oscillospiraceae bacterium]